VSYHKLYDILKQHQHEVNEIRAEKIACIANPLSLVAQQQPDYHPQTHPTYYTQNSSTRSQQAATRNREAHNVTIDSLDMNYDRKEIDQDDDDNDLAKEQAKLARRNSTEYVSQMELECAKVRAPNTDEVIRLDKASRSKLSDLIRPFDYTKLNNLYDLFVPQREKSFEQRYFSERSRLSHINVNNGKSKESLNKQTTLLEKRMDESIPLDKQCQSSLEFFKVKSYVNTIISGVELCKQKIANRTYIGYIDPLIQSTIKSNFCPVISRISAGLNQFHRCLNKEMVADLRYFNSLESEVDSLRSQLKTQKTQFLNEIDRLSRKYYYAYHMNAIIGMYTELDEVTNLQCDYLELLENVKVLKQSFQRVK
nr:hypothetical protein [Tanacetum cinerariifolium]